MERTGDWQVIDPLEAPPRVSRDLSADEFLHYLVESRLFGTEEVEQFLADHPGLRRGGTADLVAALTGAGLLNDFQASRLLAGRTFGLVLGNYRIVEKIGAGGMGVVYRAEHIHMKRLVAIKVLAAEEDRNSVFLQRFYSEMQALAVLSHPNIVLAFDAGEVDVPHSRSKVLRYLVMEYVSGKDLEQYVNDHGPLPVERACDYVRQAAEGLRHAHEHGLVHRDVKPSNLLVTPQDHVKILDFGLARLCRRRCTEAFSILGTVDYMAPEQGRDARTVDIRADIYALGGTLYWALTGKKPFPGDRSPVEELLARQREAPAPVRQHRPEVPLELEAVVCQMMARDPDDRYPTPLAVITALNAFLDAHGSRGPRAAPEPAVNGHAPAPRPDAAAEAPAARRVLLVSGDAGQRAELRRLLEGQGLKCAGARSGDEARACLAQEPCDLLVLDARPAEGESQPPARLCQQLRAEPACPDLKVLLLTATAAPAGGPAPADDYVRRSAPPHEILARVRALLRLRDAEGRAAGLAQQLQALSQQVANNARVRDADQDQAQDVLIFAMAKMAELRGLESAAHLVRLQGYVRLLAEEAARPPAFAGRIDPGFVRMLERCVLLHDIGKVAIPDHILLKPGRLDAEERSIMESHTVVGANILEAVVHQNGAELAFLRMAIDVARYHHERYDGQGYPEGLAGEAIPLAARIVTVADVYDAMRCKLVYKPGLSHAAARRLILNPEQGQFDPNLVLAFQRCDAGLEQIFEQNPD